VKMSEDAASRAKGYLLLFIEAKSDVNVGRFVAGSPELDVWSSGETELDALKRAEDAIRLFLNEIEALGTLEQVLRESNVKIYSAPPPRPSLASRVRHAFRGAFTPLTMPIPHHATC